MNLKGADESMNERGSAMTTLIADAMTAPPQIWIAVGDEVTAEVHHPREDWEDVSTTIALVRMEVALARALVAATATVTRAMTLAAAKVKVVAKVQVPVGAAVEVLQMIQDEANVERI